ncbi:MULTISPECIES: hypothetical protein [unclassified Mesobacillus]|jgi:hypothetical protein|uniref:hypothetical protein n=1 Tax=unclassified Mesobacillus TaxID=2675270 RepID=UPI0020412E71|nr:MULTISPECIES: hypothetical protein [unclassified Mesobacillus]MCM3123811.1 hypothetical protein [Mesobacillus sp. MER 33]MCM3234174.1 hypothetical protein [Mesobacillus sp. MER 48]
MGLLTAAVVVILFLSYTVIKNLRQSAQRGEAPDISNPSSAPDSIGGEGRDSDDDGDGDGGDSGD